MLPFFLFLGALLHTNLFVLQLVIKASRHHKRTSVWGFAVPAIMQGDWKPRFGNIGKYGTSTKYGKNYYRRDKHHSHFNTIYKIRLLKEWAAFHENIYLLSIYFGLPPKDTWKIAFELVVSNNLKLWKLWRVNKLTDSEWYLSIHYNNWCYQFGSSDQFQSTLCQQFSCKFWIVNLTI